MLVKLALLVSITNVDSYGISYNNATKLEGKIVGGQITEIERFPHAVFMHVCLLHGKGKCYICGSSILNQRLLITAAHCTEHHDIIIDVRAGATNILKAEILKDVHYYMYYERYDSETVFGDIALLMLADDLPLGKTLKRVAIKSSFHAGTEGHVAGWGCVNEQQDRLMELKSVEQTVWDTNDCVRYHEDLVPGAFCANAGNRSMSYPYVGDSGSGFVTGKYQLIGLVSYRHDEIPDLVVYTNVSYFIKWVEKSAKLLYKYCCLYCIDDIHGREISTQIKISSETI